MAKSNLSPLVWVYYVKDLTKAIRSVAEEVNHLTTTMGEMANDIEDIKNSLG